MLAVMRNQAQSWLAKVLLGGIAISFGLWGVGDYFMGNHVSYVAEVDGTPITDSQFQQAYERQVNSYRSMLGKQFSKSMMERLGIKNDTLQTMINRQLMLDEATHMGLVASDAVLASYVQSNPSFQEAGVFNPQRYRILTRNMGFRTTRDYENDTRANLMINALQRAIIDSAHVSEQDIRAQFQREFEQRTIAAVLISPADLKQDIPIDDAQAKAWYKAHPQNYQSKLSVKIQAVVIDPTEIAKDLQIDEEDIKQAYEDRKASFTQDGKTQSLSDVHDTLKHSLLTAKARDEAYNLSQDLDNALGMEDSLEAAAKQVGLAVYNSGEVNSSSALADSLLSTDAGLRQKAFTTTPGEAVDIEELDDGRFVALSVVHRTEPHTEAFADVAARVYADVRADAVQQKVNKAAKSILANVAGKTPDAVVQAHGYAKFLSKPVRRNGEGDDSAWLTTAMIDAAFQTDQGQWNPTPVQTNRGLALVYVQQILAGDDKVFAKQQDDLKRTAQKTKGAVRFARWMATVRARHDIEVHQNILAKI
ncbi:MAG: SurA N-terminal domain-containing protein [Mariprofundaceae bacterium]|nr:SurA N-terminal domain-containing protein [Mariprofundaceae bacterium]